MWRRKKENRGKSLFVEKWNPSAKKFINTCAICGKQGYKPSIAEEGFIHPAPNVTNHEHDAIFSELSSVYEPLALDSLNRCENCAKLIDKKK